MTLPTKHLRILMPATLWYLFAPIFCSDGESAFFSAVWDKFALYKYLVLF